MMFEFISTNQKKKGKKKKNLAQDELVESEKKRRIERLLPHYQNDVWEKKEEPPEN